MARSPRAITWSHARESVWSSPGTEVCRSARRRCASERGATALVSWGRSDGDVGVLGGRRRRGERVDALPRRVWLTVREGPRPGRAVLVRERLRGGPLLQPREEACVRRPGRMRVMVLLFERHLRCAKGEAGRELRREQRLRVALHVWSGQHLRRAQGRIDAATNAVVHTPHDGRWLRRWIQVQLPAFQRLRLGCGSDGTHGFPSFHAPEPRLELRNG